jgi:alkylation response protein AidB-like acyl-CoA dehydrogenase
MTTSATSGTVDQPLTLDEVVECARELVPMVREHAAEGERLTHVAPVVIDAIAEAGLFAAMVPKRFGGHGLGFDALAYIARELAHGDASTAWTVCFLIEHNWMACHLPMATQEELFAERNYILAAAPLGLPYGSAERVDGGFRITGPGKGWPYGSGLMHSDWNMVGALVPDPDSPDGFEPWAFCVRKEDMVVFEDSWQFSGMAATGSVTSMSHDLFVPARFAAPYSEFLAADAHPGAGHEERSLRMPLAALEGQMMGFLLGTLERMVELGRERLETTRIFDVPRIDQALSRARWAQAHQMMRAAQLMFQQVVNTIASADEGDWNDGFTAQSALDETWIARTCIDAARLIADGAGSSALALGHPLQRHLRDMTVLVNHVSLDYDYGIDAGAKRFLGLGVEDILRPKSQLEAARVERAERST